MQKSLAFLKDAPLQPKFYFKSRGANRSVAGFGRSGSGSLKFGGRAFCEKSCQGIWSEFPTSLYLSPTKILQEPWNLKPSPLFLTPIKRTDTPSFPLWKIQVQDALHQISQNRFAKVVLARQTTLSFHDPLCPYQILQHLNPLGSDASLFFLQISKDNTFLGATPEKLFSRVGATLTSEALAGTKLSTETWTDKERCENSLVRTYLDKKFSHLCQNTKWHPLENRPFGPLCHLFQKVEGSLKQNISDDDLIANFHPTPAVGGYPQEPALSFVHATEPFHRGWYGGPLGLLTQNETDMAVSIRSLLLQKNEMHLFAGAGIVQGSDPAHEWEELDRKIAPLMRLSL
jgi:menaquinone-specific isochorismate synthase